LLLFNSPLTPIQKWGGVSPPFFFKNIMDRHLKKIFHQAQFLQLEEEELLENQPLLKEEFFADLRKYCLDNDITYEQEDSAETKKKNNDEEDNNSPAVTCDLFQDRNVKNLYRALAFKYHPDKNPNNKEAELTFQDMVTAKDNCDLVHLVNIACEAGLISDIKQVGHLITEAFLEKNQKIDQIKNCVSFQYSQLNAEDKIKFIRSIVK
tara:strand:- start:3884 stop:4507 length:624 start_codon:yes stop_codon:yes gene_type:complete